MITCVCIILGPWIHDCDCQPHVVSHDCQPHLSYRVYPELWWVTLEAWLNPSPTLTSPVMIGRMETEPTLLTREGECVDTSGSTHYQPTWQAYAKLRHWPTLAPTGHRYLQISMLALPMHAQRAASCGTHMHYAPPGFPPLSTLNIMYWDPLWITNKYDIPIETHISQLNSPYLRATHL